MISFNYPVHANCNPTKHYECTPQLIITRSAALVVCFIAISKYV